MNDSESDEFHGHGGSYEFDPATGERRQVEKPTEDHPEGGGARDEKGKLTEKPDATQPALPKPAPAPWLPQNEKKGD